MNKKQEYTREDTKIAKAFAIFLMLYHHLFAFPERMAGEHIPIWHFNGLSTAYIIGVFGKLCVAIFVFLGGYGVYHAYKKENSNKIFLKKKLILLYSNYFKMFFFVIIITLIFKIDLGETSLKVFVLNMLGISTTYVREWWFFTMYVIYILLTPLLIKLFDSKYLNLLLSISLAIISYNAIIVFYPMLKDYFTTIYGGKYEVVISNIFPFVLYLPIYLFGLIFAKYDILSKIKTHTYGKFIYSIISFILIILIVILRLFLGHILEFIPTITFVVVVMIIMSNSPFDKLNTIFIKIGSNSTNIWYLHSFYCYKLCKELIYAPKYSVLIFLWLLVMCYFTGIIIDYLWTLKSRLKIKNMIYFS